MESLVWGILYLIHYLNDLRKNADIDTYKIFWQLAQEWYGKNN